MSARPAEARLERPCLDIGLITTNNFVNETAMAETQALENGSKVSKFRNNSELSPAESVVSREEEPVTPSWIILPNCGFRKVWDCIQAFILIITAIIVPYRVGFAVTSYGIYYIVESLMDVYFWCDMVLNFLTAFEDPENQNKLVTDHKAIARHYLAGWLIPDALGCLPMDLVLRLQNGRFLCSFNMDGCTGSSASTSGQLFKLFKLLRLFRLMKLLRLIRIKRLLERYQDDLFEIVPIIDLLKLISVLFFLGHFFGCFFYFFSTDEWRTTSEKEKVADGSLTPWLLTYELHPIEDSETDLLTRYIACMYWAFTTMTTVGYGDISAATLAERSFAILSMIAGGFVFSGIIGSMTSVLNSFSFAQNAYKQKMDEVGAFVKQNMLPKKLRVQILSFYRQQEVPVYDTKELLGSLPINLRQQAADIIVGPTVLKSNFFTDIHEVFLLSFVSRGVLSTYGINTVIFEMGSPSLGIHIIQKGSAVLLDNDCSVLKTFENGQYFGEGCFFGELLRPYSIYSTSMITTWYVEKDAVMDLFEAYPEQKAMLQERYMARCKKLQETPEANKVNIADFLESTLQDGDEKPVVPEIPALSPELVELVTPGAKTEATHMSFKGIYDRVSTLEKSLEDTQRSLEEMSRNQQDQHREMMAMLKSLKH